MSYIVLPLRLFSGTFFINYSYVVIKKDTNDAIIIDPAWECEKIVETLSKYKVKPSAILLTHSHFDHVNCVEALQTEFGCVAYISKSEFECYDLKCKNLHLFDSSGQHLIGSMYINIHLTPGHTAGSACYEIGSNLFTGDTLFIEGCGLCYDNGADPGMMYDSLMTLKKSIPGHFRIFPGHSYGKSPGVTFKNVLLNNIYMNLENKSQFIEFRMRKSQKNLICFK